MYFLLAIILTGIISYLFPIIAWNSSWMEIIQVLKGEYGTDFIESMDIIHRFGVQNDYNAFFQEKFIILLSVTFVIFNILLTVCWLISRMLKKNKQKNVAVDRK